MKVILAHTYSLSYLGGGEKFLIELGRLLRQRGLRVELRGLPINRRWGRKRGSHVRIPEGVNYREAWLHEVDADVVYLVYAPLVWRLFLAECPKIAGIHGPALVPELQHRDLESLSPPRMLCLNGPYYTAAYYFRRVLGWRELKSFDAVHVINNTARVQHPRTVYIPLFVDTDFYKPLCGKRTVFTVPVSYTHLTLPTTERV